MLNLLTFGVKLQTNSCELLANSTLPDSSGLSGIHSAMYMKRSSHSPSGASDHSLVTHRLYKRQQHNERHESPWNRMRRDRTGNTLTSPPKTISCERTGQRTHTPLVFHIPVLHKRVVSRSEVVNNALRVRERRHLTGLQEVLLIDAVQERLFSSKPGSLYRAIMASTGGRLGSLDALKSRSAAIMLHRTSGEIIPGISIHTCPPIFTSQRELVWASLHLHSLVLLACNRRRKEKHLTKGIYICCMTSFCVLCLILKACRIWDRAIKLPLLKSD